MDILSTLQECSLGGVSFPIASIIEGFGHDTPQHKAVDRDGAFIENTGRNPLEFSIIAPMYAKTLARGKNETWDDLYPTRYNQLRDVCLKRSTQVLVHPLYGEIQTKVTSWKSSLNADERGGQIAEISVVETRDDGVTPAFSASTKSLAYSTAVDLDSQLYALSPPPVIFTASDEEQSFLGVITSLNRIVDSGTLRAQRGLAKIDSTVAKLDKLARSIDRGAEVLVFDAPSGTSLPAGRLGPGAGRIWTNCQVLKSVMRDLRLSLNVNNNKKIGVFVVTRPMMLVSIASRLRCKVADIIALNPSISRARLTIAPDTVIRYYEAN